MEPLAPRRIAIMGAPGAGKSSLVSALACRGWRVVPESARIILQQPGGMELRANDPLGFAMAMLAAGRDAFNTVEPGETVIFDRGLCDIVAFLRIGGQAVPEKLTLACRELRFDAPVLHAPAWKAIYRPDAERIQRWDEALESDRQNLRAWRDFGYRPITLPLTDLGGRIDWFEALLRSG
ncbi:ATP-binding protein [Erythrobacter sp. SDW2]|uniref:AAA family ATPase n=1 Tax=Erythrobacter sp. SDW2 TaxID=2907154 RepID=UPI001F224CAB|nr:ATP-binding protein [Erythrobacter sp. SDW2]UIP07311.1 ATP-binding protein [Erythrobacter sp. SDW2]